MFDIFKTLKPNKWFKKPTNEMTEISVCRYSGYRSSTICEFIDKIWVSKKQLKTTVCPYHYLVHLDKTEKWQINANCESVDNIVNVPWFVLPPIQEWYFKNKNPFYKVLPSFRSDCTSGNDTKNMDMIYPANNSKLYIPVDIDGKAGSTVFKLAHRNNQSIVYWHLDGKYIGKTSQIHQMELNPISGDHKLYLVDQNGETLKINFSIINKNK